MEPTQDTPAGDPLSPSAQAELLIQNGRQRGTARPLNMPLTLIGRANGCDIRLHVDGIGAHHCVILHDATGLMLRNLQSENKTLVNDKPVTVCALHHGDQLTIGPFHFQVRLPGVLPPLDVEKQARLAQEIALVRDEAESKLNQEKELLRAELEARVGPEKEALRQQTESVTARQTALAEEETRLQQRWLALDQQSEQAQAKIRQEKDALRIQAAAVVAQQSALTEEETRLQQRRLALQQQEEQLAAHLDEKRRRLLELQEQTRAAHTALQNERAAYETRVADSVRQLNQTRKEVSDGDKQLQADRQRLLHLRKRLKRRWHRQWAAERAAMRQREAALDRIWKDCAQEQARLQTEHAAMRQARLRFNSDVELGRRQIQDAWNQLHLAQREWGARRSHEHTQLTERKRALAVYEADLVEANEQLTDQQLDWEERRQDLEKEAVGLEHRVRNYRFKVIELQQEVARLETALRQRPETPANAALPTSPPAAANALTQHEPTQSAGVPITLAPTEVPTAAILRDEVDRELRECVAALETLTSELADQRLYLTEQCQRLHDARQHWVADHASAVGELETAAQRLVIREHALETVEFRLRQQGTELLHVRQHLEGWQARMAAREAAWEGERERLLADLQTREQLVERRLQAVTVLHQRWSKRRRQEVERLHTERGALNTLQMELAHQREEWISRGALIEKKQKDLAERSLALEQQRLEAIRKAPNGEEAGRRLERLRGRWAASFVTLQRAIAQERDAVKTELAHLESRYRQLQQLTNKTVLKEAELAQQLSTWEREHLLADEEKEKRRGQLLIWQAQRERYERERQQLRDEVERLARLMIDEGNDPLMLPAVQAA